jgi:D-glycero-D-manno-heptose 1,7-bisphosphate phosphatase
MNEPLRWRRADAAPRSRAVFLDRDGVVNRWIPGGYALRESDVVFNDDVIAALAAVDRERYALVIASNQSCAGRGLIGIDALVALMGYVVDGMRARGVEIDAWYCCPHRPDQGCACRKPGPGMLVAAAADLGLDLRESWFIGDQPSDMEAARRAGVRGLPVAPDDGAGVRAQLARLAAEPVG